MECIQHVFGSVEKPCSKLADCNTKPVTKDEWEAFKKIINREADLFEANGFAVKPYLFDSSTTYEDMLVDGFKCYLDNSDKFEGISFVTEYFKGEDFYTQRR